MHNHNRIMPWVLRAAVAPVLLFATLAAAQTRPAARGRGDSLAPAAAAQAAPGDKDFAAIQDQLIKLLRLSPTLTTVVATDPTLLSNRDYVSRNNPQLAQFLASHPEIARNPDFYLFTKLDPRDRRRDQVLERRVWPDLVPAPAPVQSYQGFADDQSSRNFQLAMMGKRAEVLRQSLNMLVTGVVFLCILAVLVWLSRAFLENRRWNRVFKLQSDMHGRLIEKFGSSQELLAYLETDAGKRFLEAAPMPADFESKQRIPNAAARVLTTLQIGIVLVLVSVGLFAVRNAGAGTEMPAIVLSVLILMPGLGFIISAGITWVLAGRLGLIPEHRATQNKLDPPFDSGEQQ
jgi:hypothetical protein